MLTINTICSTSLRPLEAAYITAIAKGDIDVDMDYTNNLSTEAVTALENHFDELKNARIEHGLDDDFYRALCVYESKEIDDEDYCYHIFDFGDLMRNLFDLLWDSEIVYSNGLRDNYVDDKYFFNEFKSLLEKHSDVIMPYIEEFDEYNFVSEFVGSLFSWYFYASIKHDCEDCIALCLKH